MSDLMVDQIEFADVIVLNKIDMVRETFFTIMWKVESPLTTPLGIQVDAATKARIIDLISKLNHRAKLITSSFGRIDVKEIVNTGMFDMEHAQTGYGWLQDLHAMTLREVGVTWDHCHLVGLPD